MSSADDAFDTLMGKKALKIPVANPAQPEAPAVAAGMPAGTDMPGGAMRVSALLEDAPEYNPPRPGESGIFVTPTETDLDPVADDEPIDEIEDARRHGARIAGLDAEPLPEPDEDAEYREAEEVDDDDTADGPSALSRARRVRRLAYLPLDGAEPFEAAARDLMTGCAARNPERPSLAVTSARRGDGKTELSIRLALAMAKRVGAKILLVDFDLRRPQVAARLGVSSKYFTLVDVLRGGCLLGEALTVSEEDNLYVLPARATDRDGDEILDSREVAGLLGQLHGDFDFTIIDCGPVSRPEAALICGHAGFATLAGYCGRSSAVAMRAAERKLADAGVEVAGVLLTGA